MVVLTIFCQNKLKLSYLSKILVYKYGEKQTNVTLAYTQQVMQIMQKSATYRPKNLVLKKGTD